MRLVRLASFLAGLCFHLTPALAYTSIWCVGHVSNPRCASATAIIADDADRRAKAACDRLTAGSCTRSTSPFEHECVVVAQEPDNSLIANSGQTDTLARQNLSNFCKSLGMACGVFYEQCDAGPQSLLLPRTWTKDFLGSFEFLANGIIFGLGILIVTLAYAQRAPVFNFIIHGNLPIKLAAYGEDIQVIFKRTQRVNWFGQVIFGLVVNLSMTREQLADVRKYWLGRVIAFDSLRRQRQNELARMHLQLAASVRPDSQGRNLGSKIVALFSAIFLGIFYLLRSLFSFLFGFLFIRVNIAKLVRGTVVESKDLTLLLQAKNAIESTAGYLKEYIDTANTFDDRDEVV